MNVQKKSSILVTSTLIVKMQLEPIFVIASKDSLVMVKSVKVYTIDRKYNKMRACHTEC